jgi:Flavin containing amine oxidoreductase
LARYLIRPFRERPPAYLTAFEYGAWAVANLHLTDRPPSRGFELAWDNVFYESPSLGYVVNTHQLGIDRGPAVFTWYYPLCDDNPRAARARLLGSGWAEWAEVALADLTRAHGDVRPLVERLDVMRWGHAMVRPKPGLVWDGARAQAVQPFRGVHFAGADLSGLALFEEAFYHGVRAAEEVLSALGRDARSIL